MRREWRARDVHPVWSPDGTRIAFIRVSYGTSDDKGLGVCVVSVDRHDESCVKVPNQVTTDLLGWAGPLEIAGVFVDSGGVSRVLAVNTETREYRELAEGPGTDLPSYAAGWITCFCRRSHAEPYQSLLLPVARPEQAIRIDPGDPPPPLELYSSRRERLYLDRVSISGAERSIPVGGEYQVRLHGWDADARPAEPLAVRWESRDTTIAAVQRDGKVQARRMGRVTIAAIAGGWRSDSVAVTIGAAESRTVLIERWNDEIEPRWVPFGEPRPFVAHTTRGAALAPNGDSTFTSGVYLRRPLPGHDGLGVEFDVSAPITSYSWQYLEVGFVAANLPDFSRWDHRTGALPLTAEQWRSCRIDYPVGQERERIQLRAGIVRNLAIPSGVSSGDWMRVLVQFFPDGRCGLAVNGRARVILDRPVPLGDSALLVIQAYSHRTRFLIGPLTVWIGVRPDVNWIAVDTMERVTGRRR